jgi:outer membrane immunogenic protein
MMKKLLLAGVASAALAGSATAADLARPVYKRPVYVPIASWTGFYVGADIGAAWQNSQTSLFSDPGNAAFATCFLCSLPFQPEALTAGRQSGLLGGLHAGYNYQLTPVLVVGGEWDFMWANKLDQSANAPLFSDIFNPSSVILPVPGSALHFENQTKWLASLRGRAGYLVTASLLAYGTGGVAWGRFENAASASCLPPFLPNGCIFDGISAFSHDQTKVGYVVGAGVEYQIPTTQLRARLEYLYYGFNNGTTGVGPWISVPAGGPLMCGTTASPCSSPYGFSNTNIQTLRVGISYAFGYAAAPAVYK